MSGFHHHVRHTATIAVTPIVLLQAALTGTATISATVTNILSSDLTGTAVVGATLTDIGGTKKHSMFFAT